jgi:hypothetical protein
MSTQPQRRAAIPPKKNAIQVLPQQTQAPVQQQTTSSQLPPVQPKRSGPPQPPRHQRSILEKFGIYALKRVAAKYSHLLTDEVQTADVVDPDLGNFTIYREADAVRAKWLLPQSKKQSRDEQDED